MPFTHTLEPVILSVGPFALRWYSLVYVAGFLLAYWLLHRAARDGRIRNLDREGVESFTLWLIVGSILAARLAYVIIYNPAHFFPEVWRVLFVWEGGLSFHGGFLGAILAGWCFSKRRRVSFYALGDLLVLPLSLMLVFGRIANFVNGELVGRVTDAGWCVTYPENPLVEGCRHPSQFYEAAKNLVTFLILLPLATVESCRERLREGTLFWLFIILYSVGRVITDFWRAPDPTDFTLAATGLLVGQWLSIAMALLGTIGLIWLYAQKEVKKGRGRKRA